MRNPFLIGAKVYLRPLEREDAPAVAPWLNDPEVNRTLLWFRPLSVPAEAAYLEKLNQEEGELGLGVVVRAGDRLVGVTGLHQTDWRSRHASFGIVIGDKEEWGKGYGTEAAALLVRHAFETLNLNKVWLHVLASHERAVRSYERVGFRREGVLRQHLYREGRYQDLLAMGILRADWDAGAGAGR